MTTRSTLEAQLTQAQRVTLSAWETFVTAQRAYLLKELTLQARTIVLQQDEVTAGVHDVAKLRADTDQIIDFTVANVEKVLRVDNEALLKGIEHLPRLESFRKAFYPFPTFFIERGYWKGGVRSSFDQDIIANPSTWLYYSQRDERSEPIQDDSGPLYSAPEYNEYVKSLKVLRAAENDLASFDQRARRDSIADAWG